MKFVAVVLGIIYTVTAVAVKLFVPMSPCPEIFRYHQLNVSNVWVALVFIPPPQVLPIKLDVFLYLQAALLTKYVGILELNEPRNVVLARLAESGQKPVSYIIRFPLPSPLPTVKNISVNNNILCIGPPVIGPVITTIHLEHTLFPRHSYSLDSVINRKIGGSSGVSDPYTLFEDWNSGPIIKNDDVCGQPVLQNPLIAGGRSIRRGEWPWLVAVFVSQALGLQFHCSATLISDRLVMTAGHCMDHEETGVITADAVLLYLGKFNLRHWTEPNSVLRQALDVYIHPNYNRHNFTADLALVKFEPIKFTAHIKPACLWSGSSRLDPLVGKMGTASGGRLGT